MLSRSWESYGRSTFKPFSYSYKHGKRCCTDLFMLLQGASVHVAPAADIAGEGLGVTMHAFVSPQRILIFEPLRALVTHEGSVVRVRGFMLATGSFTVKPFIANGAGVRLKAGVVERVSLQTGGVNK